MTSITLLLLVPITVSSFPVSLVTQAEDLKSVLRFVGRNPAYAQVLSRVGATANTCIEDIEDTIDDAIDRDIDDDTEAGIVRMVAIFLTKHKEPILNYSRNSRFDRNYQMSSVMVLDLAKLCRDIRYRAESVVREEQKYRNRIAQIF